MGTPGPPWLRPCTTYNIGGWAEKIKVQRIRYISICLDVKDLIEAD